MLAANPSDPVAGGVVEEHRVLSHLVARPRRHLWPLRRPPPPLLLLLLLGVAAAGLAHRLLLGQARHEPRPQGVALKRHGVMPAALVHQAPVAEGHGLHDDRRIVGVGLRRMARFEEGRPRHVSAGPLPCGNQELLLEGDGVRRFRRRRLVRHPALLCERREAWLPEGVLEFVPRHSVRTQGGTLAVVRAPALQHGQGDE
mmetsp:Transcript_38488/g.119634  ORF Transcript_38488/g.119634 Transcript_38488/m.119634 type:complete len:200 (+) Transcript_38488:1280-1879(+)